MANQDRPTGARVIGGKSGYYEGQLVLMNIPSTDSTGDTFVNDIVSILGGADANGIPTCKQAAVGGTPCGIIVAMEPLYSNLELKYRVDDTSRYVWVNTDPNVLFEMQYEGTFTAAQVGLNAEITVGSGSTLSGLSAMEVEATTPATTSTFILHIEGLAQREDNAIGEFAKLICSFNVHQYGSVGVDGV